MISPITMTMPVVVAVSVDGGQNSPSQPPAGADFEVALDIEVAGAVAPRSRIAVYFAPNSDQGFLDAVSADRAVLIGESGAGGLTALELAATRPERVQSLVLMNTAAKYMRGDDYPHGHPPALVIALSSDLKGSRIAPCRDLRERAGARASRPDHEPGSSRSPPSSSVW